MNASSRHHLSQLDRTIVHLLNERARLVAQDPAADHGADAHMRDLLQRSAGPFPADDLRKTFESIRSGCGAAKQ
jgi:chorismate mutase